MPLERNLTINSVAKMFIAENVQYTKYSHSNGSDF